MKIPSFFTFILNLPLCFGYLNVMLVFCILDYVVISELEAVEVFVCTA